VLSGGSGREFTAGVYSHAERLLIVMDIDRMFSDDEWMALQRCSRHLALSKNLTGQCRTLLLLLLSISMSQRFELPAINEIISSYFFALNWSMNKYPLSIP